jgi:ferritin
MNEQLITSKIQQIQSEALKQELLLFLDKLLAKQVSEAKAVKKIPKFGCAKGTFKMAEDFDEPLEDFKDYMP